MVRQKLCLSCFRIAAQSVPASYMARNAGTMMTARTTPNIMIMGSSIFIPAFSPSLRAIILCCSMDIRASRSRSRVRPRDPFFRF